MLTRGRITRLGFTISAVAIVLSGCGTPLQLRPEQLASLGVREGAMYWAAEQKLMQEGYSCYVSGAARENFDCTKNTGFLPTCIHRVKFDVDGQNLVSNLRVLSSACIGSP